MRSIRHFNVICVNEVQKYTHDNNKVSIYRRIQEYLELNIYACEYITRAHSIHNSLFGHLIVTLSIIWQKLFLLIYYSSGGIGAINEYLNFS